MNAQRAGSLAVIAITAIALTACGGGDSEPTDSPTPSASVSSGPIFDGSDAPIIVPTPSIPPDGIPGVPADKVNMTLTASQASDTNQETWPLGQPQIDTPQYVKVPLPENAKYETLSFNATPIEGQQPSPPVQIILANMPKDGTCDATLIAASRKNKTRIVKFQDPTAKPVVYAPNATGSSACAQVIVPNGNYFQQAVSTLSLSWSTPQWTNEHDWYVTTFTVTGTPKP